MNLLANPNRRQFLAASAATIAAGRLRAADPSPYGNLMVGAQSYCFRDFPLEQALKQYQTLQLKYAEFNNKHIPLDATPEQLAAVRKLCKEYGVTPIAYGVEGFGNDIDKNRKKFEFAKALGITVLSADPDPDSFGNLDKLCDEYKIAIAIHPHGPSKRRDGTYSMHRWYSAETILPAVKDHHPLIGSCIDTGHILRCSLMDKLIDPADQIRKMGNRNFGLHLKDFDQRKKEETVLGKGSLDVPDVVKALKEVKFAGCVSLEYELNSKNPTPDMAEGLKVLQAAIAAAG
jgi:sugar phosphate isomerase/epimerase